MTIDPTGGWAKATEATSKAVEEVTKATRAGGAFIAPPLAELVGIASDYLQVVRFECQVRFAERVQAFVKEREPDFSARAIPPNFALPLIEQASLEEDTELQDIWARMLANAIDANSTSERRTAFITMLKDMTAFDVSLLAKIQEIGPSLSDVWVFTLNFPDSYEQADTLRQPSALDPRVAVSLGNLDRLGCINPRNSYGGPLIYLHVRLTDLGAAFIVSCTTGAA